LLTIILFSFPSSHPRFCFCFFFFFLIQEHKLTLFTFHWFKSLGWGVGAGVQHHTDPVSSGLSRMVASKLDLNHATVSRAWVTFPQLPFLWFCLVCCQESLCCFLLCTHKHISCPRRIWFHLRHKHLQF
jgi:hypothetical protein